MTSYFDVFFTFSPNHNDYCMPPCLYQMSFICLQVLKKIIKNIANDTLVTFNFPPFNFIFLQNRKDGFQKNTKVLSCSLILSSNDFFCAGLKQYGSIRLKFWVLLYFDSIYPKFKKIFANGSLLQLDSMLQGQAVLKLKVKNNIHKIYTNILNLQLTRTIKIAFCINEISLFKQMINQND